NPLIDHFINLVKDNRDFRYLWFSQVISLLGDWFNLIASASLVADLSGSGGLAIGGLFLARLLPPFVLGPIAGVLADRFDRRKILIISDLLRAGVVLGFLFIRSESDIWLIYVLTTLQLSISSFFEPARSAVLPGLVTRRDLITANALSGATWSSMLALGAATGGLVTALFGITSAFIIDAATYLISAYLITRIAFPAKIGEDEATASTAAGWQDFIEGITYLRQQPEILAITLLKASSAIAFGAIEIIQVAFAEDYFPLAGNSSATLGLIYFVVGLGTGLGPIVAQRFSKDSVWPMYYAILIAYGAMGIGCLLLGWAPTLAIVLVATFIRTIGTGINWVYSSSLIQMRVPDKFLGRIFAFDLAMTTLAASASTFWGGWAKDTLGYTVHRISFVLAGICLVMGASWALYLVTYARKRYPLQSP
ncbi:MAG: MFS transporter, partial [Anaerolineae bacterium]|nr:MFS transporter [Anaerolineae bacterium]